MNLFSKIFRSTLGRKYLMALSGCALFLFVVGHLIGNLQVFLGRDVINAYGHFLQTNLALLWSARLGLLLVVGLHIWSAITLTLENRAARPRGYEGNPAPTAASYGSRTMMMSGLIIAAFIVYHLLHFTVQVEGINLQQTDFKVMTDAEGRHDVFGMMITGFQHPLVSGFYVLGVALLCLHLSHGLSAMFQTAGWRCCCPQFIDRAAKVAAALIFLGYISIPIAILVFRYGAGQVT